MPQRQRSPSPSERRRWQASPESAAFQAAARAKHEEATARVNAYRAALGEGLERVDKGAGNYQVGAFGAAKQAQWVLVECQWQGGSKQNCSQPIKQVHVRYSTFVEFDAHVNVCDTHYPAYIAAAKRNGILV